MSWMDGNAELFFVFFVHFEWLWLDWTDAASNSFFVIFDAMLIAA